MNIENFPSYKPKTISQVKNVKGDETMKNEDVVLISKTKVHFEISTIAAVAISHSLLLTFNDHHRSSILTLHISALLNYNHANFICSYSVMCDCESPGWSR